MTVVHEWLAEPLPRAVRQAIDRLTRALGVAHVAIMPDCHLAADVCVGTVLGTAAWGYPQAVGGDIGCGMAAFRIDADRSVLADAAAAEALFSALRRHVPTGRQRRPRSVDLPFADPELVRRVRRDAAVQLGTLGRGNHFLEVQVDADERLWLMIHTGSRAVGPAVRDHHLARGDPVGGGLIGLRGPALRGYLDDQVVALDYAAANRRAIADGAERALHDALGVTCDRSTWIEVVHNFVRAEVHEGRELLVHRKGAAPAGVGEPGVIPGSMGARSFHVEGRGVAAALGSSSHGAGRQLARGEAARTIGPRRLRRQLTGVFFEERLAGRLCDEAPAAYKDIGAVMRAQRELVRIVRELRPVLSYKGA